MINKTFNYPHLLFAERERFKNQFDAQEIVELSTDFLTGRSKLKRPQQRRRVDVINNSKFLWVDIFNTPHLGRSYIFHPRLPTTTSASHRFHSCLLNRSLLFTAAQLVFADQSPPPPLSISSPLWSSTAAVTPGPWEEWAPPPSRVTELLTGRTRVALWGEQ